ncbi:MAG: TspO/MBR family protein [Gemmataceae bacterium]
MPESSPPSRTNQAPPWALAATLLICLGTEVAGGLLTATSVRDWYQTLNKPDWTPPSWLFAPVWTLLYLLMAVSAWLIWKRAGIRSARWELSLFLVQLVLNLGWSALFFTLQQPGLAFVEIVLLWIAIAATIVSFRRISGPSAALLLPYLIWVTFATTLNGTIWWLNS